MDDFNECVLGMILCLVKYMMIEKYKKTVEESADHKLKMSRSHKKEAMAEIFPHETETRLIMENLKAH